MTRLIVRRLVLAIPTLLLVSILVFVLVQLLPGNVARAILGPHATPQQVASLNHRLGTDRPILVRYGGWLSGFLTGHWGNSLLLDTPIRPLIFSRIWNSLQLAAVALVVTIPLSIGLGALAGLRRDGLLDRAISVVSVSTVAIPEFVSGVFLLVLFAVALRIFPVSAQFPPGTNLVGRLHYLVLPAIPLVLALFGYIARMARAGVVETLDAPYVRTAVLKGLPRRRVVFHHILRNGLLPTITVIGAQVGWLIGGLVVIETLFNYPGIGRLVIDSAVGHDVPVLEEAVLVVAFFYVLSNLAADILVAVLNPRVRTD